MSFDDMQEHLELDSAEVELKVARALAPPSFSGDPWSSSTLHPPRLSPCMDEGEPEGSTIHA